MKLKELKRLLEGFNDNSEVIARVVTAVRTPHGTFTHKIETIIHSIEPHGRLSIIYIEVG